MADVWGPDGASAAKAGRARTARHASRTSMGPRRVGRGACPVRHAQVTADVVWLAIAPVLLDGTGIVARLVREVCTEIGPAVVAVCQKLVVQVTDDVYQLANAVVYRCGQAQSA